MTEQKYVWEWRENKCEEGKHLYAKGRKLEGLCMGKIVVDLWGEKNVDVGKKYKGEGKCVCVCVCVCVRVKHIYLLFFLP